MTGMNRMLKRHEISTLLRATHSNSKKLKTQQKNPAFSTLTGENINLIHAQEVRVSLESLGLFPEAQLPGIPHDLRAEGLHEGPGARPVVQ